MFKTLKGKITLIYLFLVLTVAVVGIFSVVNFYNLSKSINGLMVDNYKSIDASSHMIDSLDGQNSSVSGYIYTGNQNFVDKFYGDESTFYKWYNVEANNITEPGENAIVNNINKYYLNYLSLFSQLQTVKNLHGTASAWQYYNSNISPAFSNVRTELGNLKTLNENAMFAGKNRVTVSATNSMHLIMVLSVSFILFSFIFFNFFTNKLLKPLYILTENMKSVRRGHWEQQAQVDSNDEIGGLALEFNNMTTRLMEFERSSEGKLLEEKNKSIAIVKSISDPLVVLDTHFKVILINHACQTFFNIDEKEALDKHFLELIRNNDVYEHIVEACDSKDDKYRPRIVSINAGKKQFFFDIIVTKVKDEESTINGVVVLFQNVTKLKRLEKVKTEFISTISHELKTPLTSIMMGTSLLKNDALGALTDKQEEIVHTIEDDTQRLSTLVNDIIQLSKIESDRALFHFETCSIFGIVENSIKGFTEIAHVKDISLYSEVSEKLPKITADREKITWVINNLISNAVKFTNAGDEIIVSAEVKNNMMSVSVRDTGMGIPEEYSERIFDRFVKVKMSDSKYVGTGIGLTIAREIVEAHRGTISCESKLDEGSNFTFTLPLAD